MTFQPRGSEWTAAAPRGRSLSAEVKPLVPLRLSQKTRWRTSQALRKRVPEELQWSAVNAESGRAEDEELMRRSVLRPVYC